ncbi:lamin tail domain-containing protein [Hymenobacter sp. BRD128]|uniref:lamin tail domain-containing protein n=1 Tax=Hymenobacter sp. BRD128 TaxID=2675878 RepID=UPI001567AE42|nr:lamin tail domain-containing protein [Hymenobacter sp. BRD128]QKG58530.1 lamin tail domain-containing protein [Hymenobacter sp. BRD128]
MKHFVLFFFWLPLVAQAQLADSFTDGNFTANPTWTGDAGSFAVANQLLQSAGPAVTGTQIQLVTPCQASTGTSWEFWANLRLATSSGNLADVWLLASQADLKNPATKGYFVRLGGTDDEVSLFRKDSARSPVLVIDGLNGTLASTTNNVVRVRVTRSLQGQWTLARDLTGGRAFVAEASQPLDNTYQRSAVVGVSLLYSSANSKNFYFDDFNVVDTMAPLLVRAAAVDARTVDVVFNEAVSPASATDPGHYRLGTGAGPTTATVSALNPAVVRLTFGRDLGASNSLEVRQVADLYGNVAAGLLTATFGGVPVAPRVGELLITEILAKETPVVGLPASEFIELYNNSAKTLSLRGVRLLKPGSTTAAGLPDTARLLPGQYAVVCSSTRAAQFAGYGKVYGVSNFPVLTNAGDQLVLRGRDGSTLFEIAYADTWYRDLRKAQGGWTLEMLAPANYCGGAPNWQASQDPSGGTPGRRNSVAAPNPDRSPPGLLGAVALTPTTIRLSFGEKLDSAAVASPALYTLQSSTGAAPTVTRAAPVGPDFRAVDLAVSPALLPSRALTVAVARATDCVGNASGALSTAGVALPEAAQPGDVVVNEVLFNHAPGGVYFVELLNRSLRYVNLQGYQLATQKAGGGGTAVISPGAPYVLAPGQLVALTSATSSLQAQYPTSSEPAALLAVAGFPALDNSAGTVFIYSATGTELDHYAYDKSQHLSLLSTQAGVSLERIRANGPSLASNFHSAAGTVNYATPGRPNSQAQDAVGNGQELRMVPELFTPDDDGQQDFTTLNYELDQPGYVGSVTVYDAQGQLTRRLLRNESLPTTGFVQWDGLNEHGRKAAVGYYLVHVELFRPSGGERREYRKTVVVGARL